MKTIKLKTIEIKDKGSNKTTLDNIKSLSTQSYSLSYKEIMKETRERYLCNFQIKENNISYACNTTHHLF